VTHLPFIARLRAGTRAVILAAFMLAGLLVFGPAAAEPYLAVESGLKCANCHVNPSGGGKRNVFGAIYARTQISAHTLSTDSGSPPWTGEIFNWLGLGGDYRGGYSSTDFPGPNDSSDWATEKATLHVEI